MALAISDLYDQANGTPPLRWGLPAVADGVFSEQQGLVWVDTVACTVTEWTPTRITFTPEQAGREDGNYWVHVDNHIEVVATTGRHIVETPAVQLSDVEQVFHTIAQNISQQSQVEPGLLHQVHDLAQRHVSQQGQITWSALAEVFTTIGENIVQQGEIERWAIDQGRALVGRHIAQQSQVAISAAIIEHNTVQDNIAATPAVQQNALGQGPAWVTHPQDLTLTATDDGSYYHDFTRGAPIDLGGFQGIPSDGVYTDHRASEATGVDSQGVVQTVATDVPVIVGATLAGNEWSEAAGTQGLQLEESRTNITRHSNDLLHSTWTRRGNPVIANNAPDPFGGNNASSLQLSNGADNDVYYFYTVNNSADLDYSPSFWLKFKSTSVGTFFGFRNATDTLRGSWTVDGTLLPANEWVHITASHPAITEVSPWSGSGSNLQGVHFEKLEAEQVDIDVCGVQYEQGPFPTSLIHTTGSAVTRAATYCSATFAQLGDPLPAGGLTNDFCGQIVWSPNYAFSDHVLNHEAYIWIGADLNEYIQCARYQSNGWGFRKRTNGVSYQGVCQPVNSLANIQPGDIVEFRFRVSSATGVKCWARCSSVAGNAWSTMTNANADNFQEPLDTVTLLGNHSLNTHLNGQVKLARLVPEALSDAEIEAWPTWSPPS
jgi:hypothetical protein